MIFIVPSLLNLKMILIIFTRAMIFLKSSQIQILIYLKLILKSKRFLCHIELIWMKSSLPIRINYLKDNTRF